MPLVPAAEIVGQARAAGRGAGAFNVIGIEHAEAIVTGAEAARASVVLQLSENCVAYHGSLGPVGAAMLALARASAVPVAVHLDHATSEDLVTEAVRLGFGSVMFDASALPYAGNVAATARVAAWCHDAGRLGRGRARRDRRQGRRARARRPDRSGRGGRFVAATGVDALAVAVGSSHAMTTRDAVLDLGLVARIAAAVPVPLVLHGSSGVPDAALAAAVAAGLTKINIATQLNKVFTAAVRRCLAGDAALTDPRRYLAAGREAVAGEVARLLGVLRADTRSCA